MGMSYSLNVSENGCYPNTTVLINKLGITDENILKENESFITGTVAAKLIGTPLKESFGFDDYKAIHYELFSELYDWAGEIRKIVLSKAATVFAKPDEIEMLGYNAFDRLRRKNYLVGLPEQDFVAEVAELYNTINILHPFREGNGRTQRVFFKQLIRNAGYDIEYSNLNSEYLMVATIQAASGVMDNLIRYFSDNIKA